MEYLKPKEFLEWLAKAEPGDKIIVYRCPLGVWNHSINNIVTRRVQKIIDEKRDQLVITTFHRRLGRHNFGLEAHVLGPRARRHLKKWKSWV